MTRTFPAAVVGTAGCLLRPEWLAVIAATVAAYLAAEALGSRGRAYIDREPDALDRALEALAEAWQRVEALRTWCATHWYDEVAIAAAAAYVWLAMRETVWLTAVAWTFLHAFMALAGLWFVINRVGPRGAK